MRIPINTYASCGKKSNDQSGPIATSDSFHSRPLEITQKETVTFIRQEQMISRYDCKGMLTSRKIETINSLSKKITIKYENRKKAWDYAVYNRKTKSQLKGAFVNEGKFVTDYAPTVFNMRVKAGINDVEYIFYRCPSITTNEKGEKTCSAPLEVEKEGIVQLDVYYTSETLANEQHIKPSAESCR